MEDFESILSETKNQIADLQSQVTKLMCCIKSLESNLVNRIEDLELESQHLLRRLEDFPIESWNDSYDDKD